MRRILGASALLIAGVLAGCDTKPEPANTWHKNVGPLVQRKCGGCHVEGGIAPFSLQTYAQAHEMRDSINAAVRSGHMPPWMPAEDCAEYQHERSLDAEELALLTGWVDAGAPEGDPAEAPTESEPAQPGLSRVDSRLTMPTAYTPRQSPDDYRCFLLDWPYTDTRYVTGFRGEPGNRGIVHHVIAFLAEPQQVAAAQALDDAEEGPGYTCFGGPGLNSGRVAWLGSWAPGSEGLDYPEKTGLRVAPGSKVILQVHYNTSHAQPGQPGTDTTSIALKVDSTVDKVAIVQPFTNPNWVTNKTMVIPAGQADVVHGFTFDPSRYLEQISGGVFQNNQPMTVHDVGLHMHTLGTSARLEIQRRSGTRECMLDIPRWDFHWQSSYAFTQPKVVNPGDALRIECHFNNSRPGAVEANWGEGTGDEMCLGLLYLTQ
jgi:hypothetical protein